MPLRIMIEEDLFLESSALAVIAEIVVSSQDLTADRKICKGVYTSMGPVTSQSIAAASEVGDAGGKGDPRLPWRSRSFGDKDLQHLV
ncbi:hypothetical protein PoB_000949800 [Plakobranchus ocellatus]|uniref:Uncharacterized protein n=1 Tax=Plakobranchus ocellatus TaxID=259542 RepID=A0AAV3YKV6_9GAST|nr:hypothetical protein PoB_000949800 [Plakobranchus ocellatus]